MRAHAHAHAHSEAALLWSSRGPGEYHQLKNGK